MKVISEISVISTLQDYQRFYRADPYSVHPRKVISIELLYDLVSNKRWDIKVLNQLVTEPLFKASGIERNVEGNIIAVKPGALSDDFLIDFSKCAKEAEEEYIKARRRNLQDGDIILLGDAHAEGYIGYKTSIIRIKDDQKAILLGHLIKVRPDKEKINPYFLLAYLNSEPARYILNYSVRGQTVGLHAKDAGKLPVLLPPREIQDSIGDKLKQAIGAKIEAEEKNKEIEEMYSTLLPTTDELTRYKKEISTALRLLYIKKIGRVDPQYFSVWIREVIDHLQRVNNFYLEKNNFLRGKTPSECEYKNSGVFVVKVRNILPDGRIEIKGDKSYIDESNFKKNYKNFVAKKGDIIFVATGKGSIGRIGVFLCDNIKAIASGELLIYRENDELKRWLILGLFLQPIMQNILDKIALGPSGQTHLYPKQITKIPIPKFLEDKTESLMNNLKDYFSLVEKSLQFHSQAMKELNRLLGLSSRGDGS